MGIVFSQWAFIVYFNADEKLWNNSFSYSQVLRKQPQHKTLHAVLTDISKKRAILICEPLLVNFCNAVVAFSTVKPIYFFFLRQILLQMNLAV